jgi:hypothetical protein
MRQAQPRPGIVLGALREVQKTPVLDYAYPRLGAAAGVTMSSFAGRKIRRKSTVREISEADAIEMIVSTLRGFVSRQQDEVVAALRTGASLANDSNAFSPKDHFDVP